MKSHKVIIQPLTHSLQGHISAIYASSFFHLFNEERQLELAKRLLTHTKGSIIFGSHVALLEKGYAGAEDDEWKMFCHSPESWKELWDGQVFVKGTVKVTAELQTIPQAVTGKGYLMQ